MNTRLPRVTWLVAAIAAMGWAWFASAQSVAPPDDAKAADLRMPALDRSSLDPHVRVEQRTDMLDGERNPFGVIKPPVVEEETVETEEIETEEMKLRRILANTRVTGFVGSGTNRKVLMGPLQLQVGHRLPQLFANQAEVLRVAEITDREVKFVFQDRDPAVERTFSVAINLQPGVASLLYGEFFTNTVPFQRGQPQVERPVMESVQALVKAVEETGPGAFVQMPPAMMGNPMSPDETETPPEEP